MSEEPSVDRGLKIDINGEEREIDFEKWAAPATNGNLFAAVQYLRNLIFLSSAFATDLNGSDKENAKSRLEKMRDYDDLLAKLVGSAVAKEDDQ